MGKKVALTILAVLFAAALFGCNHYSAYQSQQSELDLNWGRSFETAKYSQILNPDAVKNLEPAVGRDGNIADRVMTDYRDGKPPKKATQLRGFEMGDIGD